MPDKQEQVEGWAVSLPRAAAAEACALRLLAGIEVGDCALRLLAGIEVGETADAVWLRGRWSGSEAGESEPGTDEALRRRLQTLPTQARYVWRQDGRLRPESSLLATATLPALAWVPLASWARVELPPARLPAGGTTREGLRLVPAHTVPVPPRPSATAPHAVPAAAAAGQALLLEFAVWQEWALAAPGVRLARLVFAVTEAGAGRVLVRGTPLPSAPGRQLVETGGVIVPAGLAWLPAVSAAVVRRVCGAGEGDVLFWDETGARVLAGELFVPATRAAVRASAQALAEARTVRGGVAQAGTEGPV